MFSQKYIPALLLFCLLWGSCVDEITFDLDALPSRIAVEGFIGDSLNTYTISLSSSAVLGVGTDNIQPPISNAAVKVIDDQGNEYAFPEGEPGQYSALMQGVAGRAYHVEIVLADGKKILSTPTVLPERSPMGPVNFRVEVEEFINSFNNITSSEQLYVDTDIPLPTNGDRPYLRWRAFGEYEFRENYPGAITTKRCYTPVNLDFNVINAFETLDVAGDSVPDHFLLKTLYDYRFAYVFCLHLTQFTISREEFLYWQNVQDVINRSGSLFDPPPGTLTGNLYNPDDPDELILGYFSVAATEYKRFFTGSDFLDTFIGPRCTFPWRTIPNECFDCRAITNTSTERPPYWIP
ncbi:MAG: DUF4249 domain-containing protein [Bacteroidota bacterium]